MVLFFLFIANSILSQEYEIWIGENLNEIKYRSGKWSFQSETWDREIKIIDLQYFLTDDHGEVRHKINFQKLSTKIDTIVLTRKDEIINFIKPRLIKRKSFDFHSFELDILDVNGNVKFKYHINKYGLFRKSNHQNKTEVERLVTEEELKGFLSEIKCIDIKNMNKAEAWRNQCDDEEYSFTFWDNYGTEYNFTAINPRLQLIPIKKYIIGLER